jgi:hypothetical protein
LKRGREMAYRVQFPPDSKKDSEPPSGLSLPKNTGDSGDSDNGLTEGRIIAVLIDSPVVGPVWFAFDDGFKSGDDIPVFFASELPVLRKMSEAELRRRYEEKRGLGGGWIRDRRGEPWKH